MLQGSDHLSFSHQENYVGKYGLDIIYSQMHETDKLSPEIKHIFQTLEHKARVILDRLPADCSMNIS
jgi:hypothetical protein